MSVEFVLSSSGKWTDYGVWIRVSQHHWTLSDTNLQLGVARCFYTSALINNASGKLETLCILWDVFIGEKPNKTKTKNKTKQKNRKQKLHCPLIFFFLSNFYFYLFIFIYYCFHFLFFLTTRRLNNIKKSFIDTVPVPVLKPSSKYNTTSQLSHKIQPWNTYIRNRI